MNHSLNEYPASSMVVRAAFSAVTRFFGGLLAVLCCAFASGAFGQGPESAPPAGQERSTATIWSELLQKRPYPHTAPLPPAVRTALDGTYTRFDPKKTPPVPCRRCPDYAPEGGIWKLNLGNGVFRIFHEVTGWRSLGSFIIDGNRIQLFNDPCCIKTRGFYRWTSAEGRLMLQAVEDPCAIGLRAKNLTKLPWLSCRTFSEDAGSGSSRRKPPGCE